MLTAIIFFTGDLRPVKYRNIKGSEKFERFAMGKFGDQMTAINFYHKDTKKFSHQVKFK